MVYSAQYLVAWMTALIPERTEIISTYDLYHLLVILYIQNPLKDREVAILSYLKTNPKIFILFHHY